MSNYLEKKKLLDALNAACSERVRLQDIAYDTELAMKDAVANGNVPLELQNRGELADERLLRASDREVKARRDYQNFKDK